MRQLTPNKSGDTLYRRGLHTPKRNWVSMSTKSLSHNEAAETATQCDAAPHKRELWLSINSNIITVFKVKLNGCFNIHLTQRGTFLSPIVALVPLSSVSGCYVTLRWTWALTGALRREAHWLLSEPCCKMRRKGGQYLHIQRRQICTFW